MDFVIRNFDYVKKRFGDFIDEIANGEKLYLRSLSAEKPSELPTELTRDFPSIAEDFQLPPELAMAAQNMHSSPLRISGPVNMWLHYDVGLKFFELVTSKLLRATIFPFIPKFACFL